MKCQNCGRELKNGARFCISCGAQHDASGQLISNKQGKVDYNKTMMASNVNQSNNSGIDYNKTMMAGSTGFKQYEPLQNQQRYQNYDDSNNNNAQFNNATQKKKKISPIFLICPLIVIGALAFSVLGGKNKKNVDSNVETFEKTNNSQSYEEESAEVSETIETNENIHLKGYWSADAEHFFIDGKMQKSMWIEDYYVDENGDKVVSSWIDNKYYVDATGKKARNEWIEFTFYGEDGQKKVGFYYVDSDGLKVMNQIVDGRYLNDAGCYWPEFGEVIQNIEKKNEKIDDIDDKLSENETKNVETTFAQFETTINQNIVPQTTAQQIVIEEEVRINVIDTVSSDGNIVGYYTTSQSFLEKNITKFVDIVVDDTAHNDLKTSVKEWSDNRDRLGFVSSEAIIDDNMSITYDVNVERNDGKIFSIYETKTKYDTNKTYEKIRQGATFDVKSGQALEISALFNGDDKYEEFSDKVLTKLKSNKNSIENDIYQEIIEGDAIDVYDYCTWYMSEKGITIIFNSDSIGSTKLDGISFTLTYDESGDNINKLLLSKYRH